MLSEAMEAYPVTDHRMDRSSFLSLEFSKETIICVKWHKLSKILYGNIYQEILSCSYRVKVTQTNSFYGNT